MCAFLGSIHDFYLNSITITFDHLQGIKSQIWILCKFIVPIMTIILWGVTLLYFGVAFHLLAAREIQLYLFV